MLTSSHACSAQHAGRPACAGVCHCLPNSLAKRGAKIARGLEHRLPQIPEQVRQARGLNDLERSRSVPRGFHALVSLALDHRTAPSPTLCRVLCPSPNMYRAQHEYVLRNLGSSQVVESKQRSLVAWLDRLQQTEVAWLCTAHRKPLEPPLEARWCWPRSSHITFTDVSSVDDCCVYGAYHRPVLVGVVVSARQRSLPGPAAPVCRPKVNQSKLEHLQLTGLS